jgi:hypothetical protein
MRDSNAKKADSPKKRKKRGPPHAIAPKRLKRRELAAKQGLMTLASACELLRQYEVPGYTNRESARVRIVVDKAIPFQMIGKQYFVPAVEVHKLIGARPLATATSEDQALLKFYLDDPANNYIKAVALGLARSLQHAKSVYDTYQESLRDPRVLAAEHEKKREAERAAAAASAGKPCASCGRTNEQSQTESAQLVQDVTGDVKGFFDMTEEIRLQEFFGHRCRECLAWRKGAPIEAMRAKLQAFAQVPEKEPKESNVESDLSSTPSPNGGAKTADGIESVSHDADVEEVPSLPTNSDGLKAS